MVREARIRMRTAGAALLAALTLAGAAPARAQGVQVALVPARHEVTPGSEFDLVLRVTQAGAAFNAFRAVVSYDSTALAFVPLSPLADQQGCLMTGGCSTACGTTFHQFAAAGDSLAVYDALLCDQTSLTGPGAIYTLRFQASDSVQVTHVRVRRAAFYDAGLFVTPVVTADCEVGIGVPLAVGDLPPTPALRVRAEPNPAFGRVALAIAADRAGVQTLEVVDPAGRLVRRIEGGWRPAGERVASWDGADATGRPVAAGVYLVRLRAAGRVTQTRIALLR